MSTRSRIIAAQAVVVCVLVGVVFFTLLRPQGPDSLLGVDVPGTPGTPGSGGLATPTPGSYDEPADGDDDKPNGDDRPGAAPEGSNPPATGTAIIPDPGLAPPPPGTDYDDSPADDQYANTLGRLADRLY